MTPEELRARLEKEKPMSFGHKELDDFMCWLPLVPRGSGEYTYNVALNLSDEKLMKYWFEFCLNGKERYRENK